MWGKYLVCFERAFVLLSQKLPRSYILDTHNTLLQISLLLSEGLLSRYTLLLSQLDVQSHPMQSIEIINAWNVTF